MKFTASLFIGLDLSLSCSGVAWSVGPYGSINTDTIRSEKIFGAARLAELRPQMADMLNNIKLENGKAYAAMEDYAMGGSGRVTGLAEWGGLVKLMLHEMGIPVLLVAPATLKYLLSGNGHAQKPEMQAAVELATARKYDTHDEADAAALVTVLKRRVLEEPPPYRKRWGKHDKCLWKPQWETAWGRMEHWTKKPVR